jgi:hypothetical protein
MKYYGEGATGLMNSPNIRLNKDMREKRRMPVSLAVTQLLIFAMTTASIKP